ncbi:uncharacterized protein SETTUDRAFT_169191 [Exserohilum turcica Et28A]|uniref:Uncharacterized protein n=1 Tax=Exserohilum turcicum (strain 28A) TaxID=671987 RepID=R0IN33_EXST2|nr:uncharacterized protein SETTUDRAFT_169191 [Exserohilum turcica Et28A]EOA86430.1 hypothetical protein SETTUDRAFT_169191 [Exserohilum turcica Et28A]
MPRVGRPLCMHCVIPRPTTPDIFAISIRWIRRPLKVPAKVPRLALHPIPVVSVLFASLSPACLRGSYRSASCN